MLGFFDCLGGTKETKQLDHYQSLVLIDLDHWPALLCFALCTWLPYINMQSYLSDVSYH